MQEAWTAAAGASFKRCHETLDFCQIMSKQHFKWSLLQNKFSREQKSCTKTWDLQFVGSGKTIFPGRKKSPMCWTTNSKDHEDRQESFVIDSVKGCWEVKKDQN